MAKKKKEEKEPNLKLSLMAAIAFALILILCILDGISTDMLSDYFASKIMLVFMSLCACGCVWLIFHIIKLIKQKNQ